MANLNITQKLDLDDLDVKSNFEKYKEPQSTKSTKAYLGPC